MDIFEFFDRLELGYRRRVPKKVRKITTPIMYSLGFAIITVIVIIGGIPAYFYLKWTDQ